jgi:hypothetical protein
VHGFTHCPDDGGSTRCNNPADSHLLT